MRKYPIIQIAVLIVFVLTISYPAIVRIDNNTGNNIWKYFNIKRNCDYKMPNQYFLVKNIQSSKYAVLFLHLDRYPHYLHMINFPTISPFFSNMGYDFEATTFSDSCEAKDFCRLTIESDIEEKNKNLFK